MEGTDREMLSLPRFGEEEQDPGCVYSLMEGCNRRCGWKRQGEAFIIS